MAKVGPAPATPPIIILRSTTQWNDVVEDHHMAHPGAPGPLYWAASQPSSSVGLWGRLAVRRRTLMYFAALAVVQSRL
jgi:hypothetical protein